MPTEQPIKVSVVLCTFNGAAFLPDQLGSIRMQTYPIHELVVVDDASVDDSFAILESFAARHPFVRLYRNETNIGYNKNFEKALSLAGGEVLAPADQDDIWHPEKIATLLRHWPEESPLIYCDSVLFSGQVPARPQPGRLMNRVWGDDPRRLAVYNTVSGHALLLRRHLLALALPFDSEVYYDWWLAMVAMSNGGVVYHPEILVYQRRHQQNVSLPVSTDRRADFEREKKMVLRNLQRFGQVPNLQLAHRQYLAELYGLWQAAMGGRQKGALFVFLLQYRNLVYCSKKRKLAILSQVKRSFQYAFR